MRKLYLKTMSTLTLMLVMAMSASAGDLYVLGSDGNWYLNAPSDTLFEESTDVYVGEVTFSSGYFCISDTVYGDNNSWSDFSANHRYGPYYSGDAIYPNTETYIYASGNRYADDTSYYLASDYYGTYTVTVNLSEGTILIYDEDYTVDIPTGEVYVLGTDGEWDPTTPADTLFETSETGVFEGTVTAEDAGSGYAYFCIVSELGTSSSDWTTINANRYSPKESNTEVEAGNTYDVYHNYDTSWMIAAGDYKLTIDFNEMTLTVASATEEEEDDTATDDSGEIWSLSGDINSWSDASGSGYEFTYEGDGVYTLSLETLSGTFKLRKDYAWDENYGSNGSTINVGETYTLVSNASDNISITDSPELSGVTLTFTISDSEATLLIEAESSSSIDYSQYSWSLCGEINSWAETDTTYDFTDNGDKTFSLTLESFDQTEFKLVADHSWDVNFGGDGSTAVTIDTPYTLVLGSSKNLWMDADYTNITMTLDCSVEAPTLTVTVEEEATDSTTEEEQADGISNISVSSNGTYDVYTLTGMHVMTTTDNTQLESLPQGMYIINRKKVVVK